jgi:hypothetical protein
MNFRYVFSFLFGLKTASTIGNTPQPRTREEYLFTALAYVVSLFLFASIVGQIRNIIGSLSTKQDEFLIVVDTTKKYFINFNVPALLSKKINLWFDYYIKEENAVPFKAISFLPKSVQTDLAIAIYLDLISKVKLFQVSLTVLLQLTLQLGWSRNIKFWTFRIKRVKTA